MRIACGALYFRIGCQTEFYFIQNINNRIRRIYINTVILVPCRLACIRKIHLSCLTNGLHLLVKHLACYERFIQEVIAVTAG